MIQAIRNRNNIKVKTPKSESENIREYIGGPCVVKIRAPEHHDRSKDDDKEDFRERIIDPCILPVDLDQPAVTPIHVIEAPEYEDDKGCGDGEVVDRHECIGLHYEG